MSDPTTGIPRTARGRGSAPTGRRALVALGALTAVVIASAAGAASASAATLFVAKGSSSCSNTGAGTATRPFCAIAPAASRAVAGDTVRVGAGTYNETVTVARSGTAGAPITFTAAPGATVTVAGGTGSTDRGFYVSGRRHVTIRGFVVANTAGDGIVVTASSNITIRENRVTGAGEPISGRLAKGIRIQSSSNCMVSGNTVDRNTDYGIYLEGATGTRVLRNIVFANARQIARAASGIRLYNSSANTVASNVSHHNEDSGIESFTGSRNNLVVNNVTYANGDHGIDNYSSSGQRIVGNTVYGNVTAGINLEVSSTGATVVNNIAVDNGIASPRTSGNIRVDSTSHAGTTVDWNLVHLRTSGTQYLWGTAGYSTRASFAAASGQEAHGVEASPLFANASGGDFRLKAGSPAIDSANSGASGQQAVDARGAARFDDPATVNAGAGPRSYDDRGAYEFRP